MPSHEIKRDGFKSAFGRFYAIGHGTYSSKIGSVELVEPESLKSMFLPRMTKSARDKLTYQHGFIRAMFLFYGVDLDEDEFSGQGTRLLQKKLKEGKFDEIPDHVKKLREQMHVEWLEGLTLEEIANYPEWAMRRFFVDAAGNPVPSKTTEVVGFPLDRDSSYRAGNLRTAAGKVAGLHHATGYGSTQTIYAGWSKSAVEKAAKEHGAKQAKAEKAKENERQAKRAAERQAKRAAENERQAKRTAEHEKRVAQLRGRDDWEFGPTGRYMIDCEEIEEGWSSDQGTDNMVMFIRRGGGPGLYKATFDFGILKGMIVMGTDDAELDRYCAKLDRGGSDPEYYSDDDDEDEDEDQDDDDDEDDEDDDDDEDDEDGEDSEDDEVKPQVGSKRKASSISSDDSDSHNSKRPKKTRHFLIRLRCKETGEGQIYPDAEKGTLTFDGPNFASFTAVVDLPCVGSNVVIKGREICGLVGPTRTRWSDYNDSAYEHARVARWR